MKKLLILMLVFGMVSAANAAIMLSVDGDTSQDEIDLPVSETVTIGVFVTDTADYLAYLSFGYVSEGGFELSNPRYPWPGVPPIIIPYPINDVIEFELSLTPPPDWILEPGIWFEVDFTCLAANVDVFVELWDAADLSAPADSLTIHQIPEPMTLALLGLGGLFLLRRRK